MTHELVEGTGRGDVAPGIEPIYTAVSANGKPAVLLSVNRQPDSNTVQVADAVHREMSAIRPTRLVAPIMRKQRSGSIINISSFAAFEPDARFPTSAVFRAGLASFTKLLADECAADNVRVNNVLPGFIDSLPKKDGIAETIPMRRYGRMEEISELIAFLASPGAGYITGQNIRVDGGITRSV